MREAARKKAVVVGGMGVIGRNLLRWLERNTDWELIGLSRRAPDFPTRARFISVDLLDRAQAERKLCELTDVTSHFTLPSTRPIAGRGTMRPISRCCATASSRSPPPPRCSSTSISSRERNTTDRISDPSRHPPKRAIRHTCLPISISPRKPGFANIARANPGRSRRFGRRRCVVLPSVTR